MRSSFNYLRQAFDGGAQRSQSDIRLLQKRSRMASYETMEPRRLLAGIEFLAETSQVLIGGTPQPDSATVRQVGDDLIVNQVGFGERTFKASGIQSVVFVGLGGDSAVLARTH